MNFLTDLLDGDTMLSIKLASLATTHVYALLWRAGILVTGSDLTSNGQRERVRA